MEKPNQKAFTIIELLVGMLLTSLVLIFAWQAYTIGYKQFFKQKNTNSSIHEKYLIEKRLKALIKNNPSLECKLGKLYHVDKTEASVSDSIFIGIEHIAPSPINCECWDKEMKTWVRSDMLLKNCIAWRQ